MENLLKEYTILHIYSTAKAFTLHTFSNIDAAKIKLYDMIGLEEERNRVYYVDNDFFTNKYPPNVKGKYFCIKERQVSEWEKYSEIKSKNDVQNSNIVYFRDYI